MDTQRQALNARLDESRIEADLLSKREALAEAQSLRGRRGGELRRDWETELLEIRATGCEPAVTCGGAAACDRAG
jgi:hypothetical protein